MKIQIIVDNRGVPIDVRGIFRGTKHDISIWRQSGLDGNLEGSRFLADNAYVGISNEILLMPFKHASLYDSVNGQ